MAAFTFAAISDGMAVILLDMTLRMSPAPPREEEDADTDGGSENAGSESEAAYTSARPFK